MDYQERVEKLSDILQRFLAIEQIRIAELRSKDIPDAPGIYAIYVTNSQKPIYIGSTNNLRRRIYMNHLKGNRDTSTLRRKLFKELKDERKVTELLETCSIRHISLKGMSEKEIKAVEHFFIAVLEPEMND
jgi:predicted GIY-YIG superfamily endonuclease